MFNSQSAIGMTMDQSVRPTWAEVDLGALVRNYRTLCTLVCPPGAGSQLATARPRVIPIIKANAYGHGAVAVAKALAREGASAFAVALVEEGADLREAGVSQEILVLQGAWPGQEQAAVSYCLTPAVFSPESVRRLDDAARSAGEKIRVHIKIDTGLTRLGVPWDATTPMLEALRGSGSVRVQGTFSHLAESEEADQTFTAEQIRRFVAAVAAIRQAGVDPGELHVSNSGGMLYCDALRSLSARPGIALYGYLPGTRHSPVTVDPVLTLKSRIGRIHSITPGETLGYNRAFVAERATRVATLPVGYADGYPRMLAGRGKVIVSGRWANLLGKVSMDLITVDVTDQPDARVGDEVVLLGSSADCCMDARVWAELLGTIPYEVLTGFGPRIPRVYK
jgi:alanine racemase